MNIIKYNLTLIFLKQERGFTLIELLVVLVFIGVLSVIALPTFFNQVDKARESESQMIMGNLARAQQAYHWEHKKFTDDSNLLGVDFNEKYHQVTINGIPDSNSVEYQFLRKDGNNVRDYAVGVYANSGNYSIYICQSATNSSTVAVQNTDPYCSNSGTRLR
jgi:type IV pilus assembly protein PilA